MGVKCSRENVPVPVPVPVPGGTADLVPVLKSLSRSRIRKTCDHEKYLKYQILLSYETQR